MNRTEHLGDFLPECIGKTFPPFKLNLHANIFMPGRMVQTKLIVLFMVVDFHSHNGKPAFSPSWKKPSNFRFLQHSNILEVGEYQYLGILLFFWNFSLKNSTTLKLYHKIWQIYCSCIDQKADNSNYKPCFTISDIR